MLNLSERAKDYSFWRKIALLRDPDCFLAENVADFNRNAPRIKYPWYKSRGPLNLPRAYIIIRNVGITQLEKQEWFNVHDNSGQTVMYWGEHSLFPNLQSYEQAQKRGLKDNDWVYDVFFRYLIRQDMSSIIEVRKYPSSQVRKKSLTERVKCFFPQFEPILETYHQTI